MKIRGIGPMFVLKAVGYGGGRLEVCFDFLYREKLEMVITRISTNSFIGHEKKCLDPL